MLLNGEDFCSAIKSLANGVVAMDYKEKDEKVKKRNREEPQKADECCGEIKNCKKPLSHIF